MIPIQITKFKIILSIVLILLQAMPHTTAQQPPRAPNFVNVLSTFNATTWQLYLVFNSEAVSSQAQQFKTITLKFEVNSDNTMYCYFDYTFDHGPKAGRAFQLWQPTVTGNSSYIWQYWEAIQASAARPAEWAFIQTLSFEYDGKNQTMAILGSTDTLYAIACYTGPQIPLPSHYQEFVATILELQGYPALAFPELISILVPPNQQTDTYAFGDLIIVNETLS